MRIHPLLRWTTLALVTLVPGLLWARSAGAPPAHSGAPGDRTCAACHVGGAANSGPGRVTLAFSGGSSYAAGQTQRVTVTIEDPDGRRWGFQVSARPTANAETTSAGKLAPVDANTRLATPTQEPLEWITHTADGTRNGTSGPVTFEFDWTAPAADVGTVDFYVAANAANAGGSNAGDRIYTSKATLTAAGAAPRPAISEGGVVSTASQRPGIAPGGWVTILGTNLAPTSRTWTTEEVVDGALPASLEGTSVTINGKPAAINYISPTQLQVQAPDDDATGEVSVVVTTRDGASEPFRATLQRHAPAFCEYAAQGRRMAAATHEDGALVGPPNVLGAAVPSRPARPGDIVSIAGTGFGPTDPATPAGRVVSGESRLAGTVTVRIGDRDAEVTFAGLTATGSNRVRVRIPADLAAGDQPVVATINGVASQDGVVLTIQR